MPTPYSSVEQRMEKKITTLGNDPNAREWSSTHDGKDPTEYAGHWNLKK